MLLILIQKKEEISDSDFIKMISSVLNKNDIDVLTKNITVENFKALPDKLDTFQSYFINLQKGTVKNESLFKRRILGLTSFFKSAQEQLMPKYLKETDFKVIKIPMSDFQFGVYEQARIKERELEKRDKKKKKTGKPDDIYNDASAIRIFSRAFCNFVFPDNKRPMA